ncbi:MAG: SIMPL domain-containing protein [Candidatus Pacebacteria bacterium]|nr:SIMPL domain-containing protein [Candidatus Paceibacterota bacterium]
MNKINNMKDLGLITIAIAVVVFSVFFFSSAKNFSKQGSYVEVKGLSEKIVKADVAIWSMNFEVKSNDIDRLYADIDRDTSAIKSFLKEKGFDDSEINIAPVNVYQDTYVNSIFRYNSNVQLSVYTNKVDLIRSASQDTLLLIKKGVTLSQNYITFEFSDINSIKPDMLTEAIENARMSAEQFAKESNSRIGKISRANQGVFDIREKDPGSPEYKKVRVVSTIRFLLK